MQRVIGVVVVIALLTAWKMSQRSDASDDVKTEMRTELLAKLPSYEKHGEYMDQLLDDAHDSAFSASYDTGSRRRPASMDFDKYTRMVLESMSRQAKRDGDQVIAAEFDLILANLNAMENS